MRHTGSAIGLVAVLAGGCARNLLPADVNNVVDVTDAATPDVPLSCDAGSTAVNGQCVAVPSPRPTRPLTNARVSVTQPTLHWVNAPGTTTAHVSICRDRACTAVVTEFDAEGSSARVPSPLGAGVWFWNLRAIDAGVVSAARSATWSFHTPAVSSPVEWSRESRPDVNGDGIDDFTIWHCTAGSPSATPVQTEYFAGGPSPSVTTLPTFHFAPVSDVDGDGFTDLLRSDRQLTTTLLSGTQDLAMLRSIQTMTWNVGQFVGVPAVEWARPVGDFNGDGHADLLLYDLDGFTQIAYGTESGWPASLTRVPGIAGTRSVISFDVDADGFDDVLTAGPAWFRGGPDGLSMPATIAPPPADQSMVLPLGDFDGDGYLDAVQFDGAGFGGTITLIRGSAHGPLLGEAFPLLDASGQRLTGGNAGDLDGDGRTDLLFVGTSYPDFPVVAYRGSPLGFTSADTFEPTLPCQPGPFRGARPIGDWNGDGHDDYILLCRGTGQPNEPPAYVRLDAGTSTERWVPVTTTHDICAIE